MKASIQTGIDRYLQQSPHSERLALVTNNAATTRNGLSTRVALLKRGFHLMRLFSPEHGIETTGADGVFQGNQQDVITGLPVISLYGDKMQPSASDFKQIDRVLFDIPDVGCRFYTYLWTMTYVMEACAAQGVPILMLDRPNPIGADITKAEGPFLDELNCASFIGRWSIPLKHSCTLGELALYFSGTRLPHLKIEVLPVEGYQRAQTAMTDFKFVPTSPAIQNIETAMLYPGTGLFEGILINEGRGTEKPFQQLGAPWLDHQLLKQELDKLALPGIHFHCTEYIPTAGVYANERCKGIELKLTDPNCFMAVKTGVAIIQTILRIHPDTKERFYDTHANPGGGKHMDKLVGIKDALQQMRLQEKWGIDIQAAWLEMVQPYLLY